MSLERAKAYLKEYKMEDQIREFPVSSATVELAAEALHTEAGLQRPCLFWWTERRC